MKTLSSIIKDLLKDGYPRLFFDEDLKDGCQTMECIIYGSNGKLEKTLEKTRFTTKEFHEKHNFYPLPLSSGILEQTFDVIEKIHNFESSNVNCVDSYIMLKVVPLSSSDYSPLSGVETQGSSYIESRKRVSSYIEPRKRVSFSSLLKKKVNFLIEVFQGEDFFDFSPFGNKTTIICFKEKREEFFISEIESIERVLSTLKNFGSSSSSITESDEIFYFAFLMLREVVIENTLLLYRKTSTSLTFY